MSAALTGLASLRAPAILAAALAVCAAAPPRGDDLDRRLAALRPGAPAEYLSLAEDVMDRADPTPGADRDASRALARRLAATAGAVDVPGTGRSAALFLADLAVVDAERARFAAIAAALDPAPDSAVTLAERRAAALALVRAFGHYRRGEAQKARDALGAPGASALLDAHPDVLTGGSARFLADCDAMRRGAPPTVTPRQMDALHVVTAAALAGGPRSWGEAIAGGGLAPLPEVDLSDPKGLFGVDPAECVWRDGRWTRAEPAPAAR
jgi:hypothetical protein